MVLLFSIGFCPVDLTEQQRAIPTLAPYFRKAESGSCFVPALGKDIFLIQNSLLHILRKVQEGRAAVRTYSGLAT